MPLRLRSSTSASPSLADDQRVSPRDGRIVEADVGRGAAPDSRPITDQRDDAHEIAFAKDQVVAGLGKRATGGIDQLSLGSVSRSSRRRRRRVRCGGAVMPILFTHYKPSNRRI